MQAGVVGRQAELAQIARFLAGVPAGPRALVLDGEAGAGKTTLVHAAVQAAEARGLRVLRAGPAEAEQELPHAALTDLLDGIPDALRARLAVPQAAALDAVTGRGTGAGDVEPHALARGVLELLRLAAQPGDLLVVIDDAQWLDRPTAETLSFALRRLGSGPLRVLISVRTASPVELPLGLDAWGDVTRLPVRTLTPTELGAVIRQRLGLRLPRPELEALARSSGGNALFALELAARPASADTAAATLSLALAARLRRLDSGARQALAAAAAALQPSPELLRRAGIATADIDAAMATGIVTLDGTAAGVRALVAGQRGVRVPRTARAASAARTAGRGEHRRDRARPPRVAGGGRPRQAGRPDPRAGRRGGGADG